MTLDEIVFLYNQIGPKILLIELLETGKSIIDQKLQGAFEKVYLIGVFMSLYNMILKNYLKIG